MRIFGWFRGRKKPRGRELTHTDTKFTVEQWAQELKERGDYRALAAINNSTDYDAPLHWEKRDLANRILRETGSDAVDAILRELATGGIGKDDLAEVLVDIGDPKAVPLLKKMLDGGVFDAYGVKFAIEDFVKSHPEQYESVKDITDQDRLRHICSDSQRSVEDRISAAKRVKDKDFLSDLYVKNFCKRWQMSSTELVQHSITHDAEFYEKLLETLDDDELYILIFQKAGALSRSEMIHNLASSILDRDLSCRAKRSLIEKIAVQSKNEYVRELAILNCWRLEFLSQRLSIEDSEVVLESIKEQLKKCN